MDSIFSNILKTPSTINLKSNLINKNKLEFRNLVDLVHSGKLLLM